MARWIAFDQKTTNILRSTLAQGTRIDTLLRGPVDYALAKPGAVIAVLPATGGSNLGVAVFRRARAARKQKAAAEQPRPIPPVQPAAHRTEHRSEHRSEHRATTRAGGFLGLSDEPVFEDEAPQEKKGWWRKFWDE
jgi:type IV secretory pathway VirB10-like protein